MNHAGKTKYIAVLSVYTAAAFILGYIESLFPLPLPFPGMKPGFANLVILLVLYQSGLPDALIISLVRNLLNAFTFGSLFSFFYGMAGSFTSLLAMYLFKTAIGRKRLRSRQTGADGSKKPTQLSLVSVSCVGGIVHNMGQFAVAACLVGVSAVLPYLPFLYFAGLAAGTLVGVLATLCLQRLSNRN